MALQPPTLPLSPNELHRWARFGEKGGIGRGKAVTDRLAESQDELMFISGEDIVILLLLDPKTTAGLSEELRREPGVILGYCEQVVGLVRVSDVKLTTRLKKPVISTRKRESKPASPTSGGLGIEGVSLASSKGAAGSTDSFNAGRGDDPPMPSPRAMTDVSSPTSSGYRSSSSFDDLRSPARSTPASSYASPAMSSAPASPRILVPKSKSDMLMQRVYEDNVALSRPLRADPALITPPPQQQVFSYFDVPTRKIQHQPTASVSSSVASSVTTPSFDRLIDMYTGSPGSNASSKPSTTRSPVQARVTLQRISEATSSEPDAATQLGQLFMDSLEDGMTPTREVYNTLDVPSREGEGRGLTPERAGKSSLGQTPTPRAKAFLQGEDPTTPMPDEQRVRAPQLADTSPLRTARSHPNLSSMTMSTQKPKAPFQAESPLQPRLGEAARLRSATFSQVRSAKHQPPPPVTISPSPYQGGQAFVAPNEWAASPALTSTDGFSSSSSLGSPVPLASPRSTSAKRDLRIRTLDKVSPGLKAASSPLASPGRLSPSSPGVSPRAGSSMGSYFSPKRRSPSPAPQMLEMGGVQAVNNVEFEMIAPPVLPRSSNDTTGSYRRSVDHFDNQSEDGSEGGERWDDAVVKASVEDRRILRQSMIIAEAELEAAAQGLDSNGFYINAMPSTDSIASGSFRASSVGGIGSGPPSPTDSRSLESHRSRELKWVQLMSVPLAQAKKGKKLKAMVRAGIPASVRSKAWCYLAEVDTLRQPGLYHELCGRDSPCHDEIERTVSACYPPHALFASSNSPARVDLLSILKAFAVYEPRIGYSQELGRVAGILLLYVPSAEDVLWLLVAISSNLAPGLHDADGAGLNEMAFVAGHLLASVEPALAKRLVEAKVDPRTWSAAWFLPLFTQTLPWNTLLRVLDCWYLEGHKLMLRVALSLFDMMRDELLTCPFERMSSLALLPPRGELEQPQTLLAAVFSTKVKDSSLRRLQRRAEVVVRQGKPR